MKIIVDISGNFSIFLKSEMKTSSPSRISLSAIAAHAGASPATVSRVMNGTAEVSPELQERVQAAIAALGYKAPRSKTNGRRKVDTDTIGLLSDMDTSSMLKDDFQHRFLAGVEATVNRTQRHLMFASCREDLLAGRMPSMVEQKLVSGVILKCSDTARNAEWFQRLSQRIPVVLLMDQPRDPSVSIVMCDNEGGMYQSLRYLSELGHRRVGFFSVRDFDGPVFRTNLHNVQRLAAFQNLRPVFGLEENATYIQDVERRWPEDTLEGTVGKALDAWLKMGKARPTAVVCAADSYASALIEEAEKRGLRLPEDLSITGFMNTLECEHLRPSLTSVSLSGEEMGRAAVELLDQRIKSPDSPPRRVFVGSRLVERLSCTKV